MADGDSSFAKKRDREEDASPARSSKHRSSPSDDLIKLLRLGLRLDKAAEFLGLSVSVAASQVAAQHPKEILGRMPRGELICPLTGRVFEQPAVASDGFTYERIAIEEHIDIEVVSPKTGIPLLSKLTHNKVVHSLVNEWIAEQAALWPAALAQLIDAEDFDAAREACKKAATLVRRFPLKQRLAFLDTKMAVPLEDEEFKARHDEFVQTLVQGGLFRHLAIVKAHTLARGCYSYDEDDKLQETFELKRWVLPVTGTVHRFEVTLQLPLSQSCPGAVIRQEVHSAPIEVAGLGSCFVSLWRDLPNGTLWRAELVVDTYGPPADMRPLIFSLSSTDREEEAFWHQFGRARRPNEERDTAFIVLSPDCEGRESVKVLLVVRSLEGPVIAVGSRPPMETAPRPIY